MYFKNILLLASACLVLNVSKAQTPAKASKPTIYLLPDGTTLGPGKMDSLKKAWGEDRILFQHNEDDDAKGVMHLVRLTDEMKKQFDDDALKQKAAFQALLDHPAPDFALTDIDGKLWSLKALRGKVVVLNFWFTACPPCIQEIPELNKLKAAYDPSSVVFLGLAFNKVPMIREFLKEHPFSYNLLPDSHEVDKLYQVNSWPSSFVIDRKGIVKKVIGYNADIKSELSNSINASLN